MSVRVLLVDDNGAHLELLRVLMELEDDFEVVGEARDGEAGVRMAREVRPDLIISDIEMPRLDGVQAVPGYRAAAPDVVVVLMSSREPDEAAAAARRAGADAYIDKGTGVDTIVRELRRVTSPGARRDAG